MKKQNRYLILIIISIVFIFLLVFKFVIKSDRNLSFIESIPKEISLGIEKIISKPISFFTNKIDEYKETKRLYETLNKNKLKIESYEKLEASLDEKNRQIKELENLLNLKNNLSEYETIEASVIYRSIEEFYHTITIDKGSKDGIELNLAVVTPLGLIGKIVSLTKHTAVVELMTSVNDKFKISVGIQKGEDLIYGVLSNYKDGKFIIDGISENNEIPLFSKVVTTGLDNLFPSGLLIGYTSKITKDNFDLAQTIYVNPSAKFDNIRYVSVLKRNDKN